LPESDSALRKSVLSLSMLASLLMVTSTSALALDHGLAGGSASLKRSANSATPFGGAYSPTQNGKRPDELRRPSSTMCALQGSTRTRSATTSTRQEASGKLHLFNDPSTLKSRNGDIYGNCGGSSGAGIRRGAGSGKVTSAYNSRTNTLKAATDGYVNRSASSAMMPKKAPSMYDPATGVLKPSKSLNAYQIYQR
jgi:hypothetical protein